MVGNLDVVRQMVGILDHLAVCQMVVESLSLDLKDLDLWEVQNLNPQKLIKINRK